MERVEGRTARKRRAILEAATELFLDHGYGRTSMDLVASMAAVSKQTVYQQFGSKEDLFRNVVIATVDRASDPVHSEVTQLQASDDLARDLTELAHRQLDLALQPQVIQLRRLVIAESSHFPELGRAFHERGPQRTIHALTTTFARLAEEGRLRTSDAGTSANQFNWLVMADPVNRLMLLGEHGRLASPELNRHVADAVRTFLAAHNHDKDHDERSDQAKRYEDAAATFDELRRMAPAHIGALIQVYTQKHREASKGNDFLYLHFAGDCLAFGFVICALIDGGFMAGWQLG